MPGRNEALTETWLLAQVLKRTGRQGAAIAAIQIPQPAKDSLTITTSGQPATWTLTALPYNGTLGSSVNLSLNGQELKEGTDYTVDYSTGIVSFTSGTQALFKSTPTPADVVTADYWTTGDLIAASGAADTGSGNYASSAVYSGGATTQSSASVTIPTVNAGDLMMFWPSVAVGSGTTTITGPAGWTASVASTQSGPDAGHDNGVAAGLWTKIATGSEGGTTVTATFSTANRAQALLVVYDASTITAVSSSSSSVSGYTYTAPTPAASSGKTCVYFFASSASNVGNPVIGSPATVRAQPTPTTGYDGTVAGDAVATGTTAPSVSATVPGPGSPGPRWIAATVVL